MPSGYASCLAETQNMSKFNSSGIFGLIDWMCRLSLPLPLTVAIGVVVAGGIVGCQALREAKKIAPPKFRAGVQANRPSAAGKPAPVVYKEDERGFALGH